MTENDHWDMEKSSYMYIVKRKLLTCPLAQKSNGQRAVLDVDFLLSEVSSNFPMKRALTKAWQDVLTLVNQCKGWVADYVAIIDVWFSSNACKTLLLL